MWHEKKNVRIRERSSFRRSRDSAVKKSEEEHTENDGEDRWPVPACVNPLLPHAALSSGPKIPLCAPDRAQALAAAETFLHATFALMKSSAEIKVFKHTVCRTISICRRNPPPKAHTALTRGQRREGSRSCFIGLDFDYCLVLTCSQFNFLTVWTICAFLICSPHS